MMNQAVHAASCSANAATKKSQSLLFFSVLMLGFLLVLFFAEEARLGSEEFHFAFEMKRIAFIAHPQGEIKWSVIVVPRLLQHKGRRNFAEGRNFDGAVETGLAQMFGGILDGEQEAHGRVSLVHEPDQELVADKIAIYDVGRTDHARDAETGGFDRGERPGGGARP